MNMNRKCFILISIIFSFFFFEINTYAETTTTSIVCINQTDEKSCGLYGKCRWISGSCQEQSVANDPCNENNIRLVLRFFGILLQIAKVAIPLIIIAMGSLDVFKAVIDKDEKLLGKQLRVLGIRIVAGIFVFLIPTILHACFKISSKLDIINSDKYEKCEACLLTPGDCSAKNIAGDNNK